MDLLVHVSTSTFASGIFTGIRTRGLGYQHNQCPCDNGNTYLSTPFVGDDYFCESTRTTSNWQPYFRNYRNDLLWDGQVCEGGGSCCLFNNPPWFMKSLASPTTDQIELRLCLHHLSGFSDIALELLELYVH